MVRGKEARKVGRSKSSKKRQRFWRSESFSFIISLVSGSAICIFIGYLLGQYALQWIASPASSPMNQEQVEAFNRTVDDQLDDLIKPNSDRGASSGNTADQSVYQPPVSGLYRVQAGVFSQVTNAEALVVALHEAGFEALISNGPPYRVQTGAFSSAENAEQYAVSLRDSGFEAVVIRP